MICIVGATGFRHFFEVIGVRAVDVLGRSKDEHRIWRHVLQEIYGAFNVRSERGFNLARIFAEMRCEMNNHIVRAHSRGIQRIENVEMRSSRKVLGVEKTKHVRAEVTAAACD